MDSLHKPQVPANGIFSKWMNIIKGFGQSEEGHQTKKRKSEPTITIPPAEDKMKQESTKVSSDSIIQRTDSVPENPVAFYNLLCERAKSIVHNTLRQKLHDRKQPGKRMQEVAAQSKEIQDRFSEYNARAQELIDAEKEFSEQLDQLNRMFDENQQAEDLQQELAKLESILRKSAPLSILRQYVRNGPVCSMIPGNYEAPKSTKPVSRETKAETQPIGFTQNALGISDGNKYPTLGKMSGLVHTTDQNSSLSTEIKSPAAPSKLQFPDLAAPIGIPPKKDNPFGALPAFSTSSNDIAPSKAQLPAAVSSDDISRKSEVVQNKEPNAQSDAAPKEKFTFTAPAVTTPFGLTTPNAPFAFPANKSIFSSAQEPQTLAQTDKSSSHAGIQANGSIIGQKVSIGDKDSLTEQSFKVADASALFSNAFNATELFPTNTNSSGFATLGSTGIKSQSNDSSHLSFSLPQNPGDVLFSLPQSTTFSTANEGNSTVNSLKPTRRFDGNAMGKRKRR